MREVRDGTQWKRFRNREFLQSIWNRWSEKRKLENVSETERPLQTGEIDIGAAIWVKNLSC